MKRVVAWFREDAVLKAISLIIAVLIWLFVRIEEKAETVLRLPVQFLNVPDALVLVGDPVEEVRVVVEGPRSMLAQTEALPPRRIDLAEAAAGTQEFRVMPEHIPLPRGVQVVRVMPSVIEVELRPTSTYRLPVEPRLVGALPEGFSVFRVTVEPPLIEITTARGELDGVRSLRTEPINIDGRREGFSQTVNLDLGDLNVKSLTTRRLDVVVDVQARVVDRVLDGLAVSVRGAQRPLRAKPSRVSLVLRGPEALVKNLGRDAIAVYVDARGLSGGQGRLPVLADVPPQATLVSVTPGYVFLTPVP